jgi:hypothetical protein
VGSAHPTFPASSTGILLEQHRRDVCAPTFCKPLIYQELRFFLAQEKPYRIVESDSGRATNMAGLQMEIDIYVKYKHYI